MYIDIHSHYDDNIFLNNSDIMESLNINNEIKFIINSGSDIDSSIKSISIAEKNDKFYATVGIHPEYASYFKNDILENKLKEIEKLTNNKKVVGIGEIGLDYHYEGYIKKDQHELFIKQLKLAEKLNLPVVIHNRDSHDDLINILKCHKNNFGVIHSFSGSLEIAKELLKLNWYISFSGIVTFKNAKKMIDVARYVPLDRILVETDAPYLSPEPFRGKINNSNNIKFILQKLSDIKNIDYDELSTIVLNNSYNLFNKIKNDL